MKAMKNDIPAKAKWHHAHPFAEIFPLHDGQPIVDMAEHIKEHGLEEKGILYEGKLLDGRRRQIACKKADVTFETKQFHGTPEQALAFVIGKNLHRRHLGESERSIVAARIANLHVGDNRGVHRPKEGSANLPTLTDGTSSAEAAEIMNVSERSVRNARTVLENGTPELAAAVEEGVVSVSDAAKVATEPAEVQQAAVQAVKDGTARTAKAAAKSFKEQTEEAVEQADPVEDQSIEEQIKAKNSELESWCRGVMKHGEALPEDPWLDDLNRREGALQKLRNACETVRSAKCSCVCPKCDGDGCPKCHKTGRMTKYAKDQLG